MHRFINSQLTIEAFPYKKGHPRAALFVSERNELKSITA